MSTLSPVSLHVQSLITGSHNVETESDVSRASLLSAVAAITAYHHRFDPSDFEDKPLPDVPFPESLLPLAEFLFNASYDPTAIRRAIDDISRTGTAQSTPWIEEEDRSEAERLVPGNAYHWDASTDADCYGLTREPQIFTTVPLWTYEPAYGPASYLEAVAELFVSLMHPGEDLENVMTWFSNNTFHVASIGTCFAGVERTPEGLTTWTVYKISGK